MNIEAASRAYDPSAWESIDKLRKSASLPDNPNSQWPDMRSFMKDLAERRAENLLRRMAIALSAAAR